MKKLFYFVVTVVSLIACRKQNATSETPGSGIVDTSAVLKYSGTFMNGPYGTVTGNARVYLQNGNYVLKLEGVNISNGPDLHVYLSKEVQPVNYINLGRLQSTGGNQVYPITGNPDFTRYKYALVHCRQFNHLFGSALLQ